jgi:hypothetical protein
LTCCSSFFGFDSSLSFIYSLGFGVLFSIFTSDLESCFSSIFGADFSSFLGLETFLASSEFYFGSSVFFSDFLVSFSFF